ncbi:MAG TPA: hypothetical protein VL098_12625 [Flavipsychrobacter sp.]|nr:hypothetical protein [Flavipsychrobacter sp.]
MSTVKKISIILFECFIIAAFITGCLYAYSQAKNNSDRQPHIRVNSGTLHSPTGVRVDGLKKRSTWQKARK